MPSPLPAPETPSNWRRGLALALTTAFLWGILPLGIITALRETDATTLAWARFVLASAGLCLFLKLSGRLPQVRTLPRQAWGLIFIATLGLAGNYVLYTLGMHASGATTAQIVSQLGPIFMLFGGVLIFHEHLSRSQRIGVAVLIAGLLLFFNDRIGDLLRPAVGFGLGVMLNLVASMVWSVYALAQKRLLRRLEPQQVLLLLYAGSALLLLMLSSPRDIGGMSALGRWMLILCGLNTLFAYGSLAESLQCWEATRVGAVLAATPLFTYVSMKVGAVFAPALFAAERLNAASLFGAACVVLGSALCALGGRRLLNAEGPDVHPASQTPLHATGGYSQVSAPSDSRRGT